MEGTTHYEVSTSLPTKKAPSLVRVQPRYVRLRQGSEIRYHLKLLRPPTKSRGITIHVCVTMNKVGVVATPTQLVLTSHDWYQPREIRVTAALDAEIRTLQIHHKIHERYDDVFSSTTIIPSVFVSVLQKEATFLFAFGCGLDGRLGTVDEANANVPTPFACKSLHPVQIACGKAHSVLIDVSSNVYCFGNNARGQLGQGDATLETSKVPLRVASVGTTSILHVACGSSHTLCLTTEGRVFAWGDNTYGQLGLGCKSLHPQRVATRIEKISNVRNIYCGGHQSFLVMMDNNVLATGSNIAGQLGMGDRVDRVTFERLAFFRKMFLPSNARHASTLFHTIRNKPPQEPSISSLCNMSPDMELACGFYHTMALTGKCVYVWGNGDDGRLGLGTLDSVLEPTLLHRLQQIPIKSIASGGSHSSAVSINGEVYMWGNGQYGQIGNGALKNRRVPTKVSLLQGKRVSQVALGEWHSMALCDDGTVYAWGFGEEGQLGLPDTINNAKARIASLPMIVSSLAGTGATTIRCGSSHTFVVSSLEARRPQLAKFHQQISSEEIENEKQRLSVLKQLQARPQLKEPVKPQVVVVPEETTEDEQRQEQENKERIRERRRRKVQRWKSQGVMREVEETAIPISESFSWKERPLTSRLSVRNAFRHEMRVLKERPQSAPSNAHLRLQSTDIECSQTVPIESIESIVHLATKSLFQITPFHVQT